MQVRLARRRKPAAVVLLPQLPWGVSAAAGFRLDLEPRFVIHASSAASHEMAVRMDSWGDRFAEDATAESLSKEEIKIGLELSHIRKDEERMLDIKEADRAMYGRERSREIERKNKQRTERLYTLPFPIPCAMRTIYDGKMLRRGTSDEPATARAFYTARDKES